MQGYVFTIEADGVKRHGNVPLGCVCVHVCVPNLAHRLIRTSHVLEGVFVFHASLKEKSASSLEPIMADAC